MKIESRILLTLLLAASMSALATSWMPSVARAQEGAETESNSKPAKRSVKKNSGMRKLFKILKQEPSVKEVQGWALRFYALNPSHINGMATNARLKGLIPELDLSFENNKGNTFNNMRDGLYPTLPNLASSPNPDNLKERAAGTSSNNVLRVRAVWNLDRLVFNAEGLDVKSLNSLGETLVREVTTLYYSRRRLLASIVLSPPTDPEELFFELTRLDEIGSTLDSLTGNKFGKRAWQWSESLLGI